MELANFLVILISPLIAVLVSIRIQDRKEKLQRQYNIF